LEKDSLDPSENLRPSIEACEIATALVFFKLLYFIGRIWSPIRAAKTNEFVKTNWPTVLALPAGGASYLLRTERSISATETKWQFAHES
jgi:hypothetical protein